MTMTPDEIKGEAEELAARLLTLANAAGELGTETALAEREAVARWLAAHNLDRHATLIRVGAHLGEQP